MPTKSSKKDQDQLNPPNWLPLVGYQTLQSRLRDGIKQDSLHQPLMLVGRPGLGKSALAAQLAAAYFCPQTCGACAHCRAILKHRHHDVLWVESEESQITRDAAAAIPEHLLMRGATGRRIAVIIDAHKLNISASNLLLKTLEEPLQGNRIILTCSYPGRMLQTIHSRMLKVRVAPPPIEDSVKWLCSRHSETKPHQAEQALRINSFSPGKALHDLSRTPNDHESKLKELFTALDHQIQLGQLLIQNKNLKGQNISRDDILRIFEQTLNKSYRSIIQQQLPKLDPQKLWQLSKKQRARRHILSKAYRSGQMVLNSTLLIDALICSSTIDVDPLVDADC